jgi:hypothetical protein
MGMIFLILYAHERAAGALERIAHNMKPGAP